MSCAGPQARYGTFYNGPHQFDQVVVSTDATLTNELLIDFNDALLVSESRGAREKMIQAATKVLRSKGFGTSRGYQSLGLSRPAHQSVFLSNERKSVFGDSSHEGVVELRRMGKAPSPSQKGAFLRAFSTVAARDWNRGNVSGVQVPGSAQLGLPQDRYHLFLLGYGHNVNVKDQIIQGVLSGIFSGGDDVDMQEDVGRVAAVLVDPKTGEVLWANETESGVKGEDLADDVAFVLDELPRFSPSVR